MASVKTAIMAIVCRDWRKSENDFNRPLGGDFIPKTSEYAAGMLTGISGWMVWAHYCRQGRVRFVIRYCVFANCLKLVKIPRVCGNVRTCLQQLAPSHCLLRHSPALSLMSACYNDHIGRESRKWGISYLMLPDVRYASRTSNRSLLCKNHASYSEINRED